MNNLYKYSLMLLVMVFMRSYCGEEINKPTTGLESYFIKEQLVFNMTIDNLLLNYEFGDKYSNSYINARTQIEVKLPYLINFNLILRTDKGKMAVLKNVKILSDPSMISIGNINEGQQVELRVRPSDKRIKVERYTAPWH